MLTISRKAVAVMAMSQPLIPKGGRVGLLTRVAVAVSASLRTQMKADGFS
jgi:hypothetical protein